VFACGIKAIATFKFTEGKQMGIGSKEPYFNEEEYEAYMAIGTKEFDFDNDYKWGEIGHDDPEWEFLYQLDYVEWILEKLDKKLASEYDF
jgi:hypothetical protein